MSNKRILYFDSLKFFAIWLVVFGHYLMEIDSGSVGFYTNQVIYTFHMPLFIMISGFFAQKGEPSFSNLIIKKTTTLLLPLISIRILIESLEDNKLYITIIAVHITTGNKSVVVFLIIKLLKEGSPF